ncbi:MAG: metallophosphoesterase [Thermoplasmatota archaeon]
MASSQPNEGERSSPRERGAVAALTFISIVAVIVLSVSIFIGSMLSLLFTREGAVEWPYIAGMVGMTLFVIVVEIVTYMHHSRLLRPLYFLSSTLIGLFFYMFWASLVGGLLILLDLLIGLFSEMIYLQLTRGLVILMIAGPVLWGLIEGRFLRVRRVTIPLQNYRGKGARIALISDVHLGLLVGEHRLGRIIRNLRRERPDVIISGGDLLDTNPRFLKRMEPILKELTSIAPSYAVIGNHEFYHGMADSKVFLRDVGFDVLDRSEFEDTGKGFHISGVDDPSAFGSHEEYRKSIDGSFKTAPAGKGLVLANHQPMLFHRSADMGLGLMLSGHTHGGQMFPGGLFTRLIYKEGDRGLIKYKDSHLYVCLGTGSWGPPLRVGAPSEMVIINIREHYKKKGERGPPLEEGLLI